MSVCPNCHKMDKNFFAPLCHNCNTLVGFVEQCVHSLIWTFVPVFTVVMILGAGWIIFKLLT
jgi:hypothetical protein